MEDVMKTVKWFEKSGLLVKYFRETIKNETKDQEGGSLPMLLGILAASLLGSILTGRGTIRAGLDLARADQDF